MEPIEEDGSGFCVECGFKVLSFKNLNCCPQCGTQGIPCNDEDQVMVSVNWHELRILCLWAERWAQWMEEHPTPSEYKTGKPSDVIYSIADRIEAQIEGKTPLTLAHEIAKLPEELKKAGVNFGDMETNVKGIDRYRE